MGEKTNKQKDERQVNCIPTPYKKCDFDEIPPGGWK